MRYRSYEPTPRRETRYSSLGIQHLDGTISLGTENNLWGVASPTCLTQSGARLDYDRSNRCVETTTIVRGGESGDGA